LRNAIVRIDSYHADPEIFAYEASPGFPVGTSRFNSRSLAEAVPSSRLVLPDGAVSQTEAGNLTSIPKVLPTLVAQTLHSDGASVESAHNTLGRALGCHF